MNSDLCENDEAAAGVFEDKVADAYMFGASCVVCLSNRPEITTTVSLDGLEFPIWLRVEVFHLLRQDNQPERNSLRLPIREAGQELMVLDENYKLLMLTTARKSDQGSGK